MNVPIMINIEPTDDMNLIVTFEGGIMKKYDITKLYSEIPLFKELQNKKLFRSVKIDVGGYGMTWNKDIDLSRDEIWFNGEDYKV